MNQIFTFIFEGLRDIFNFLDFSLPGISLTYIDFFLLVMIISLIFRLLKGTISESGDGMIYGVFKGTSDKIENTQRLSYNEYEKRHERLQKHAAKYKEKHSTSKKEGVK